MIVAICGDEKTWKSTMALSFPRPLRHFELDVGGFKRAAWRIEDLDGISSKPYPTPIPLEKMLGTQKKGPTIRFPKKVTGIKEIWQQIVIDFVDFVNSEDETAVMDSGTQLWWLCHTGRLQELQEIQLAKDPNMDENNLRERLKPVEYPNDRMRNLLYTAHSYKKNLILTHYFKDVYAERATEKGIESYKTGAIEEDGFKETKRLVDIVLWLSIGDDGESEAKITKCGLEGLGTKAQGLTIAASYQGILDLREAMTG